MIRRLLPLILVTSLAAEEEKLPAYHDLGTSGFSYACEQEQKADFRVSYGHDDKLDIQIGVVKNNTRTPITFTLTELEPFWKEHGRDKFVCITLGKSDLEVDAQRKLTERLAAYFFKCGFRRVRIHQAFGAGVGVLYDITK